MAQQGQPGAHFIENWDLNEDGQVTVEEAAERRGDVFFTFDENEDGFLDAREYVAFDEAREADMQGRGHGQGRGAVMRAADGMLLDRNDLDGDGKVSRDEFVGQATAWVTSMDTNTDGVVTVADFGQGRGQGGRQASGQGKGQGQGRQGQGMGIGQGNGQPGQGNGQGLRRGQGQANN